MTLLKLDRRRYELLSLLILAGVTTPVFWLTDIDRQAAAWFYQAGSGNDFWPWRHWWLWQFLFRYAYNFTLICGGAALVTAVAANWLPKLKPLQRPAIYLLLVIALGPGLVVNLVFKDHWGRPRPVHMIEFAGQHSYVPPLKIGPTNEKSFPCGHCSVGYTFFALYFLSRKRKAFYFVLTVILGLTLGLTRMSAGGHFISDILWSGYLVFLVAWLIYYGWYIRCELN